MSKLKVLQSIRSGYEFRLRFVAMGVLTFLATSWLYAQNPPCMITCGTQPVACEQANSLLCGPFSGSVDIQVQDPRAPDQPLTITTIDLELILDDNGPGNQQWQGYISPAKSFVFPIVNPQAPPADQRGPEVSGSNQGRACTENNPCILASQPFETPVSGTTAQRQFTLIITQILYQDPDTQQIPRALIGQYTETISNYAVGRDIQVNGTFRLERLIPVARPPKG